MCACVLENVYSDKLLLSLMLCKSTRPATPLINVSERLLCSIYMIFTPLIDTILQLRNPYAHIPLPYHSLSKSLALESFEAPAQPSKAKCKEWCMSNNQEIHSVMFVSVCPLL